MAAMSATQLKIMRAKVRVIAQEVFWGSILVRLPCVESTAHGSTMGTDGTCIYYHPDFVTKLPDDQLTGVLMHEVGHVILFHHLRRKSRHPLKWNIAADYAINPIIKQSPIGKLPPDALDDPKYHNWATERIYADLPDPKTILIKLKGGKGKGGGKDGNEPGDPSEGDGDPFQDIGGCGVVFEATDEHGKPLSQAEKDLAEQEVRGMIQAAAQTAKAIGKLPAGLEALISELVVPQVCWEEELRRFVAQSTTPSDFSWRRPNRRMIGAGYYLPGIVKEGVGKIAFFIDTSGSVSDRELQLAISELQSIKDDVDPESVIVVCCDAQVAWTGEFEQGQDIDARTDVKLKGRGGTSFIPPFEWIKRHDHEIQCAIYLTDGQGPFPQEPPDYPTMWLMTTKETAPFGRTVPMRV